MKGIKRFYNYVLLPINALGMLALNGGDGVSNSSLHQHQMVLQSQVQSAEENWSDSSENEPEIENNDEFNYFQTLGGFDDYEINNNVQFFDEENEFSADDKRNLDLYNQTINSLSANKYNQWKTSLASGAYLFNTNSNEIKTSSYETYYNYDFKPKVLALNYPKNTVHKINPKQDNLNFKFLNHSNGKEIKFNNLTFDSNGSNQILKRDWVKSNDKKDLSLANSLSWVNSQPAQNFMGYNTDLQFEKKALPSNVLRYYVSYKIAGESTLGSSKLEPSSYEDKNPTMFSNNTTASKRENCSNSYGNAYENVYYGSCQSSWSNSGWYDSGTIKLNSYFNEQFYSSDYFYSRATRGYYRDFIYVTPGLINNKKNEVLRRIGPKDKVTNRNFDYYYYSYDNFVRVVNIKLENNKVKVTFKLNNDEINKLKDKNNFFKITAGLDFEINFNYGNQIIKKNVSFKNLISGEEISINTFLNKNTFTLSNFKLIATKNSRDQFDFLGNNKFKIGVKDKIKNTIIENNDWKKVIVKPVAKMLISNNGMTNKYPSEMLEYSNFAKLFTFKNSEDENVDVINFTRKLNIKLKPNDLNGELQIKYDDFLDSNQTKIIKLTNFRSLQKIKNNYVLENKKETNSQLLKLNVSESALKISYPNLSDYWYSQIGFESYKPNDLESVLNFELKFNKIKNKQLKKQWEYKYKNIMLHIVNPLNIAPIKLKNTLTRNLLEYNKNNVWNELFQLSVDANNMGILNSDYDVEFIDINQREAQINFTIKKNGMEGTKSFNFLKMLEKKSGIPNIPGLTSPSDDSINNSSSNSGSNTNNTITSANELADKNNAENSERTKTIIFSVAGVLGFFTTVYLAYKTVQYKRNRYKKNKPSN